MPKIIISFIAGLLLSGFLLVGARSLMPIMAEEDNSSDTSENLTQSFLDLLPDIEKIYHASLTLPFQQAKSVIYDEDIAEYYQGLLENSGLGETEDTGD